MGETAASKTMLRVDVVPWSMTRICRAMISFPLLTRRASNGRRQSVCQSVLGHMAHRVVDGGDLGFRQAQAELAAPPDDILRGAGPLHLHQVAQFRLGQVRAERPAQVRVTCR